ncbi:MAG: hypothetical protein ACE5F6_01795 [Anaerolineae bacterium]
MGRGHQAVKKHTSAIRAAFGEKGRRATATPGGPTCAGALRRP